MGTKRPSLQFYPSDWRKDLGLQTCSIEARGLWIEMMCLMHEGYPYGYLRIKGKVISKVELSTLAHTNLEVVERALEELEQAEVFSRDEKDGAIYSRRMVRDELIRNKRAEGGKLGGNPALMKGKKVKHKVNLKDNEKVKDEDNLFVEEEDEEEDEEEVEDNNKKTTRFIPPTTEEVAAYLAEKEVDWIDPEYFMDYQIARGWVLSNGKKMKDWRATIRTWINNGFGKGKKSEPKATKSPSLLAKERGLIT